MEDRVEYITVSIASGQALSTAVGLEGLLPVAIQMPSAWTAADLTFQASNKSDGTYQDVYDSSGIEKKVNAAASRWILLEPSEFAGLKFVQVRSGTAATPVNQAAARTLLVAVHSV